MKTFYRVLKLMRVMYVLSYLFYFACTIGVAFASISCPEGFVALNDFCVQQATKCPTNFILLNGLCHPFNAGSCPIGYLFINGQCCSLTCISSCQAQPETCACCGLTGQTVISPSSTPNPILTGDPCSNQPVTPYPQQTVAPCPNQPVTPYPQTTISPCPNQPLEPVTTYPIQVVTPCPIQPIEPCPPCPNEPDISTADPSEETTTPYSTTTLAPTTTSIPLTTTTTPTATNSPTTRNPSLNTTSFSTTTPVPTTTRLSTTTSVSIIIPALTSTSPATITSSPTTTLSPMPISPIPTISPSTIPPPVTTSPTTLPATTTPSPPITTSPTITPATPPPAELVKCPDGTVLLNNVCRLIYCGKGQILSNNRCIQTICPEGTAWTGIQCARKKPNEYSFNFNNTINTQINDTEPEVIINNSNTIIVNTTIEVPSQQYNEPIQSCGETEIDTEIETETESSNMPTSPDKCCIVVTPRMCRRSTSQSGKWNCYSRRYKRCGDFCIAPMIYLKASHVRESQNFVVIPPYSEFVDCRNARTCQESVDFYDCSGCAIKYAAGCSSYCYTYKPCSDLGSCRYYDLYEYCRHNQGGEGCRAMDGCLEDWCAN